MEVSAVWNKFMRYTLLLLGLILVVALVASACKPESDIQWTKAFSGESSDVGKSVQQTQDGGYVVCGYTSSYGAGGEDVWLIKTDADGNLLWDRTFGGERYDYGFSVRQTQDGGYIVCGNTVSSRSGEFRTSKLLLIKTDTDGNLLWDKTFGSIIGYDVGYSIQQTQDGGYIVCGLAHTASSSHVLLLKLAPE
jgi:hypothetical protein